MCGTRLAGGLRSPPELDATPVPPGFGELVRHDGHAFPPATPRRYDASTEPLRGGGARNPGARRPVVRIAAVWGAPLPAGAPIGTVRGHLGVRSEDGSDTTLAWLERTELLVTVTATDVSDEDLRRVATGLQEQSVDEVLHRPTGERVVVAQGEVRGAPYELRARGQSPGMCLELASDASVSSRCGSGAVAEVGVSAQGGMAFGPLVAEAARARLELPGGLTIETEAVGQATGQGAAFFVVALPPDVHQVDAVVALGPEGQVLRRTGRD